MRNPIIATASILMLLGGGAMAQSTTPSNTPDAAKPPTTNNDVAKGGTAYTMGANQYGVTAPLAGKDRHARDVRAKQTGPKPNAPIEGRAKQDLPDKGGAP